MKTLVMLGQKGGSGKTTLALNLAVAAHLQGENVTLLDADPQASALQWFASRKINEVDKGRDASYALRVASALPSHIDLEMKQAQRAGSTLCLIDTPPHLTPASTRLAERAHLALVPCRPTALDLGTLESTARILRAAQVPELVVLSGCHNRCGETDTARTVLQQMGLRVSPVRLGDRVAFSRSIASGRSVLDLEPRRLAEHASAEVLVLWDFIQGVLREKRKSDLQKSARNG